MPLGDQKLHSEKNHQKLLIFWLTDGPVASYVELSNYNVKHTRTYKLNLYKIKSLVLNCFIFK